MRRLNPRELLDRVFGEGDIPAPIPQEHGLVRRDPSGELLLLSGVEARAGDVPEWADGIDAGLLDLHPGRGRDLHPSRMAGAAALGDEDDEGQARGFRAQIGHLERCFLFGGRCCCSAGVGHGRSVARRGGGLQGPPATALKCAPAS
jgi:hypothetical protein